MVIAIGFLALCPPAKVYPGKPQELFLKKFKNPAAGAFAGMTLRSGKSGVLASYDTIAAYNFGPPGQTEHSGPADGLRLTVSIPDLAEGIKGI
ncbi:MAG: hypothetical protein A2Y02_03555 [Omnitrophica bacterium GWA2_52_12]|nr:MAG: hypothetical protein A2Y02_03555 [Omnitrophica bacterium GWA2_52_12]